MDYWLKNEYNTKRNPKFFGGYMDTDRRITTDSSEKTTAVDKALAILEAFCYRESELSLVCPARWFPWAVTNV